MNPLRSRWRAPLAALGILAALAVVAAIVLGMNMRATFKQPPAADFEPAADAAEANRQDLEYYKRLLEVDRSFTAQTRPAFERTLDDLLRQAAALDHAALAMGTARAAALNGNGHTNQRGVAWGLDLNSIPLRFNWFEEGLFVVQSDPALADLLGAKVLTEAGRTPEELAHELRAYVGVARGGSLQRELAPHFMESPQALHAAGLAPSPAEVTFSFELRDGQRAERTIAALPEPIVSGIYEHNMNGVWPQRTLSPVRIPGEERQWRHVLDGRDELPLYLRAPEKFYWSAELNGSDIVYVQINATRNQDGSLENASAGLDPDATVNSDRSPPLREFLDQVLQQAAARKPRYAVVDLRFNHGGNGDLTTEFARRLPGLLAEDGRIFIITSGNTFSAGIITAARLKHHSAGRGEIVGERIGDDEQFWAEGSSLTLPNSRLSFDYATAYHDLEHGCSWTQLRTCFFLNYFTGVAAGSLSPTIPAPLRFSDYMAGKDTAMEAIMRRVGGEPAASPSASGE